MRISDWSSDVCSSDLEPGTPVKLTIVRAGESKPLQISVTRGTIKVASVRGRMLEPGYAYIRISAFQADTAADFESTLKRLQAGSGDRLRGLVLDLRSNPGGLLTTAVQIADDLLEEESEEHTSELQSLMRIS